jgi:hypothetical protein
MQVVRAVPTCSHLDPQPPELLTRILSSGRLAHHHPGALFRKHPGGGPTAHPEPHHHCSGAGEGPPLGHVVPPRARKSA